jgi:molybdate transport system substrate-binding protein
VFTLMSLFILAKATLAQTTIAAAGDLEWVMAEVAHRFEQETRNRMEVTYGSSGNFFQQLENGAPFDLFFSANVDYPRKLEQEGLVEGGSLYEYAQGKLVIWVRSSSSLDVDQGIELLLSDSVRKIAIANPQHAPYGQAAVAAMKNRGVYDQVHSKLVLGENVAQALSFVVSGSADVGLVALSQALSPSVREKGRFAEISRSDYPPIRQACVILKSSRNKEVARQFLEFVRTPAISALFGEYGFDVPDRSAANR